MSIEVNSTMTTRRTLAVAQIIPQYRHTQGLGKRKLLTPDEVLRLPNEKMLCVVRGCNVLMLDKLDFTKHPYSRLIRKISVYDYKPVLHTEANQLSEHTEKSNLHGSAVPPKDF